MLNCLQTSRSTKAGKLISLLLAFYRALLANCKDVTELSGMLSKTNNELRELHKTAAFTIVQLVMRFLEALGLEYETFITIFQQTHNLIELPGSPAVTFNVIV